MSQGTAAYLSSISASHTRRRGPGSGAYAVSKAALDKLVEAWRAEHPQIGFTRVTVGDCAGGEGDAMTGFNAGWDMDLVAEVAPIWMAREYIAGALLEVDELVRVVDNVLRLGSVRQHPHRRRRAPTSGVSRVGIVTGAARGIGAACADRMAGTVDVLVLVDLDPRPPPRRPHR